MDSTAHDLSHVLIELGLIVVSLAILARIASRWGFSAIPLYLLAGLAFGNGGLAPLNLSAGFTHVGAEIGVLLLLFMLGLEYTGPELVANLRSALFAGVVDFALNFTPGLVAGLLLKWNPLAAVLLGGVTYVSSSGVIAKVLAELRRLDNPETPVVLSILVLEDLAMAVYLPLVAVLLAGGGPARMALSVSLALATVLVVLALAVRYGAPLSRAVAHQSDEIVLLTTFGAVLLVAGVAQRLQVSAAIGAFLVGIAVSGPMAEQTHRLLAPLRDLFAATFFFFFGLQIDPATLPSALPSAVLLGVVTAVTKVLTGFWAARRTGVDRRGRLRAGMALVARGEFSIVIAGLGAGLEPQLGPFSAAYVLFLAVLGPILADWYILRFDGTECRRATRPIARVWSHNYSADSGSRFLAVTRKRFLVLVALILVVCVICPYVEMAIDWNESIFTTGYDTESAIGMIALLVILSLALAKLLAVFRPCEISDEAVAASHVPETPLRGFVDGLPEVSPPLSLRI